MATAGASPTEWTSVLPLNGFDPRASCSNDRSGSTSTRSSRHLGIPGRVDRDDWEQVRNQLRELVGDSTFEIWLEQLELIAVDRVGTLVIAAPAATRGWIEQRFARVLARSGEQQSRALRLANEPERQAFDREERARSSPVRAVHINQREVS